MSKRMEPAIFHCALCPKLSAEGDATVTFQSGGALRLLLPTGWKTKAMPLLKDRELVDFICPDCDAAEHQKGCANK